MLAWFAILIAVVIAAILIAAAMKPATFSVVREGDINAAPDRVHRLINDFHEWTRWSPWEKLDPALSRTYDGTVAGLGAIYSWSGNKKVGQGRMEITGSTPEKINIDLRFFQPWKAHNQTVFMVTPRAGGTRVRWEMSGASPFMFRIMGLFTNMDAMIGRDFERGLANMKQAAESM